MSIKVMWFINVPSPAMLRHLGREVRGSGGWLGALLAAVGGPEQSGWEFCVCCACPAPRDESFEADGICYRIFSQPRYFPELREKQLLGKCLAAIREWQPDIIHIHGTERFYCRLAELPEVRRQAAVPAVSLQGIITPCSYWENYYGSPSLRTLWRIHSLPDLLSGRGLWHGWRQLQKDARREQECCRRIPWFFGRTEWDRAWGRRLNPDAGYCRVGEVLRDEFFRTEWQLADCRRHQIVFTNAGHPRRGTECLLEATELLKRDFPDIRVVLAGNLSPRKVYNRYLRRRMDRLGDAIELKGLCSAPEIAALLKESHVFVLSSLVENSPNSLCEAQMAGMPVVAADVGGVASLVDHGRTGLLFPKNDAILLAEHIRNIFIDDDRAETLGRAARTVALKRHAPAQVATELFQAYQTIMNQSRK